MDVPVGDSKTFNQEQIKYTNQLNIIKAIRNNENISRAQLASLLKLSAPSISTNVDELITSGLVLEMGKAESFSGRRPIMLTFNDNFGYIIAVDMLTYSFKITLSNLSGVEFIDTQYIHDVYTITRETFDEIKLKIDILLKNNNIKLSNLLCICFGSPGTIDPETERYVYAPRITDYKNIALKEEFEERYKTKVLVRNDVNCATIGEKRFGLAKDESNFINIFLDYGIGAGIFLDNKLFHGSGGASGEIGLLLYDIPSSVANKSINHKDSTDSILSLSGLIWTIAENYPELFNDIKYEVIDKNVIRSHADRLFKYVSIGDDRVLSTIKKSAGILAGIIMNTCILLDIKTVILNGALVENLGDLYLLWINEYLHSLKFDSVKILVSKLGKNAVTYGALAESISLAIHDALTKPKI